jgi:DNA-directed RNA polymerase specialized sigma24 family protein
MEADIEEGELEVDELLDETLLHAWDHFEHRPRSLPLDAWLAGLIGQVLEEQMTGAGRPHLSLDEPAAAESRRPFDDESSPEGWTEDAAADELELADLLPGRPSPDAWERLEPDRREVGLNRMLSQLTREQRQALLLSAAYGLEAAEIADIQGEGISPEHVQAAVDAGRDSLARLIEQQETWTEVQEEFERSRRDPRRRNT